MKFNETNILQKVAEAWGWAIRQPVSVLAVNSMANVLVVDVQQKLWRICPEELSCKVVANNPLQIQKYFNDKDTKADWQLLGLINEAENKFGVLNKGCCYGLIKPAVMGGAYDITNMKIFSTTEYLSLTGKMAEHIQSIPDGAFVSLSISDEK